MDSTGVGRPVIDLLNRSYGDGRLGEWWPTPITITGGERSSGLHVVKHDLIAAVALALEHGELKISPDLPAADALRAELRDFHARRSQSGHVTFEAASRARDDLVIALALALWKPNPFASPRILGDPPTAAREVASKA